MAAIQNLREILREVRRIEIVTTRLVKDVFAGEYHSVFKGRGMEFAEVREYQPGDDIRTIDWNVTARMGHPYVKVFTEERELTVMLMVDASSSLDFGTAEEMKSRIAVKICALLAFSAIQNNDKVGLIIFTDRIERFVPPKKGRKHALRLIRDLLDFEQALFNPEAPARGTDITGALEYLNRVVNRSAVVFLVSDFLSSGYDLALRVTNKRHDMTTISLVDPREVEIPKVGFVELEDAETGETILIDTTYLAVREFFSAESEQALTKRRRLFKRMDVDHIEIFTDRPYQDTLVKFFRTRAKRTH